MRAPEVRLIDEEGKLIGLMSSYEALNYARDKDLDLVEIHEKSKPPVCKVMNYGKWKFETKKKEKQNKRNQVKVLVKEIQLRPRTDEGDIKIKLQKAKEFLNQGHKVKINLRFFGREMAHKELGFKLLKQLEGRLADVAFPEMEAKMERRTLFTIFAPQSMMLSKKTSKPGLSKVASVNKEASKPEVSKVMSVNQGTPKPELSKVASVNKEASKPEVSKVASVNKEGSKPEVSKVASVNKEASKPEVSKVLGTNKEASKPEVSKVLGTNKEASKPEVSKVASVNQEDSKASD